MAYHTHKKGVAIHRLAFIILFRLDRNHHTRR